MADITKEWQDDHELGDFMLFGYDLCDHCKRIVPTEAGLKADGSLPELGSNFILCSTQCVNKWNAEHGNRKLKVDIEQYKNHKVPYRRPEVVGFKNGAPEFIFERDWQNVPYETGTFGLDRSPPKAPAPTAGKLKEYEDTIDSVMADFDQLTEKDPPKAPEKPLSKPPDEPPVPAPSPAEIAGALKTYKALADEGIIPEAEYNYVRGKIMGAPKDAAAAVAAAGTVEDIRGFKTMSDEGLITQEEFVLKRQQMLGYDVVLKKYAQDLLRAKTDGHALSLMANKTEEICLAAVQKNGLQLNAVPEQFKTLEICLAAVSQNSGAIKDVPAELLTAVLKQNPNAVKGLSGKQSGVLSAFVAENGLYLEFAPEKLKTPELYLAAVTQNGMALQFVPEKQRTKEILLAAVNQNGMAVQFLPKTMNMSGSFASVVWSSILREVCFAAVSQNGLALQVVPDNYRLTSSSDKTDVNFAAVTQNGMALQFVFEALKTKELCRAAVAQNSMALQFVPEKLRKKM